MIGQQKKRIAILEEYLRLAQHKQFAPSSEKNVLQGELFNEAELLADGESDVSGELTSDADSDTEEEKPKKRKKRQGLSADLPREQVLHQLSDEEKEGAIDTFFVAVKEELDIVPAKARVLEHMQEKAVFLDGGKRKIVAAQRPAHPLGKAIASCALLCYLIISKYADGLPLYRLEGILKRYGGQITRTTMANWLIRLSVQLLIKVYTMP